MERVWFRHDQQAVVEALRAGRRPDMATILSSGPLDELVALHRELGILDYVDEVEVRRSRRRRFADHGGVIPAMWLLISLAVAYALTRRHGPRAAEPVPNFAGWTLESHRPATSDGQEVGAWFAEGRALDRPLFMAPKSKAC